MTSFQIAFYLFGLLSLIGGAGLAWSRNVVHSALFLILALLAVAGLYLVLLADFLALVQVLIYGGAITILILFAMMLTRAREQPDTLDTDQKPWAMAVSSILFWGLVVVAHTTPWPRAAAGGPVHVDVVAIGTALFTQWAVPFEIASLVLLVALMGAIIIARAEEGE